MNFQVVDRVFHITGSDVVNSTGEYKDHNEANFTLMKVMEYDRPANLRNSLMILNGFEVDMKCTDDQDCNSNGIWPFKFDVELF